MQGVKILYTVQCTVLFYCVLDSTVILHTSPKTDNKPDTQKKLKKTLLPIHVCRFSIYFCFIKRGEILCEYCVFCEMKSGFYFIEILMFIVLKNVNVYCTFAMYYPLFYSGLRNSNTGEDC